MRFLFRLITCFVLTAPASALAQPSPTAPAPGPGPQPPPAEKAPAQDSTADDLEREFEEALAQDAADRAATAPAPATPTPTPARSAAFLNPEMSVIGTFTGALPRRHVEERFVAGDDPDPEGFSVQELEITFAAAVDPYFRMRAFLALPGVHEVEIEEAFLESTALPRGLLAKGGIFRSSFGRNNEQHLHMQDFPRRPATTRLLGHDGLRAPGVHASYLLPLPWYASLWAEGLSLDPAHPTAVAGVEQFFPLSDTWSLLLGASGGSARAGADEHGHEGEEPVEDAEREWLAGADVYLKWRPTNVTQTYAWFAVTAEVVASRAVDHGEWIAAAYAQAVAQIARRWRVGARADAIGYGLRGDPEHAHPERARTLAGTVSLTFLPSEYSRVRLSWAHDYTPEGVVRDDDTLFLQLEGAIGAHGAHAF